MNRFDEAIKQIDYLCNLIDERFKASLHMAIDAIDKQNPMEPMKVGHEHYCLRCIVKNGFDLDHNIVPRSHEYCCKCGQKIDWRNYDIEKYW